jgi:two-component system CheB/CheR fusion protein
VGVGASAGGMDAFKALVKAIPGNSGMAFILVQHLAPQYESILADILQKSTSLPVVEITDHIKVYPDHIYVIPSNKILIANDGVLELKPRVKGERLNPIDIFFHLACRNTPGARHWCGAVRHRQRWHRGVKNYKR